MTKNFYEAVENRHSIYGLSDEFVISDERLQEVLHIAVKHAPSAFNSQTARFGGVIRRSKSRVLETSF